MNYQIPILLTVLLSAASVYGSTEAQVESKPPQGSEAKTCLTRDRFGCRVLIKRGTNKEGYYLTIDAGTDGAGSVQIRFSGRSIIISQSKFRRTERTWDRGAFGVMSRSNRFSSRLSLPRDADIRRVKRMEQDGVITVKIPRLHVLQSTPGRFGYYPYR